MAKVQHSVVIGSPVEEVFDFVTDLGNAPLWQSWAVEARYTSDGPRGAGASYVYVARFLGRKIESAGEITAFEPNRRYAWKVTSGPIPMEAETVFEPVDGGTKVTAVWLGEPGGFFKLAEPIVVRMAKRQLETDFANLKDLLEAGVEADDWARDADLMASVTTIPKEA